MGEKGVARFRGASKAEGAAQAYQAYEMQREGHSLRAIGAVLGVSHETVRRRITEYCNKLVLPKAEEYRKREVERCDYLIERLAEKVAAGDVQAVVATSRIMERRAKYLGLDAALQVDHTVVQVTQEDVAFAELLREQKLKGVNNAEGNDAGADKVRNQGWSGR